MKVVVIGQDERASAHLAWFRQAGVAVLAAAPADPAALPEADLYDLCGDLAEGSGVVGALWRRRRAGVLLDGAVLAQIADPAALARAASRRRAGTALVGGWRFVPAFARLQELVAGGILGRMQTVRVDVRTPPAGLAEALPGAVDLAWWLAGDGVPVPQASGPGWVRFQAGSAMVDVAVSSGEPTGESRWTAALVADLGQAAGSAAFAPGLPGRHCQAQSVQITLAGHSRRVGVPVADPAGSELGAIVARHAAGLPWLAVCNGDRLAAVLALAVRHRMKVAEACSDSG